MAAAAASALVVQGMPEAKFVEVTEEVQLVLQQQR
jgi:hypothetical protein